MKAIVKATGEVVEVSPSGSNMQVSCGSYDTKDGRRIPVTALEFEKVIDWEQRRYEIAKELFLYKTRISLDSVSIDAKKSVEWADIFIAELKKGGDNEN